MIRVLLADDQELFRSAIAIMIDSQPDMEVVGQASTGSEAVSLAREIAPDVVLMDIRMPEMDGVEATRRIIENTQESDAPIRILVLTTFNLDDRAATAIRYGASGFLLKDATPVMLQDAIRTVFAGNAVLSPRELTTILEGEFRARDPLPDSFGQLTDKEREVLLFVGQGKSNTEIAQVLFVSESTVKSHVSALLRKLDARDRVQLVVFVHTHGLSN